MDLELTRDVLDQEVVDRSGTNMGRVDGLVMLVGDGGPPRIDRMELGFVVLARRVHPRLEKIVEALRKWSVRKEARYGIPWSHVEAITENAIKVNLDAEDTPAFAWERWLREHIVEKIPGSGKEDPSS
jgi:hypothetical protein